MVSPRSEGSRWGLSREAQLHGGGVRRRRLGLGCGDLVVGNGEGRGVLFEADDAGAVLGDGGHEGRA